MAETSEIAWMLLWTALAMGAVAHSVAATRQSHFEATGEGLPVRRVLRSRQWRRATMPYLGALLVVIAEGGSVLRTFVAAPHWLDGLFLAALLGLTTYVLTYLWQVGS